MLTETINGTSKFPIMDLETACPCLFVLYPSAMKAMVYCPLLVVSYLLALVGFTYYFCTYNSINAITKPDLNLFWPLVSKSCLGMSDQHDEICPTIEPSNWFLPWSEVPDSQFAPPLLRYPLRLPLHSEYYVIQAVFPVRYLTLVTAFFLMILVLSKIAFVPISGISFEIAFI